MSYHQEMFDWIVFRPSYDCVNEIVLVDLLVWM